MRPKESICLSCRKHCISLKRKSTNSEAYRAQYRSQCSLTMKRCIERLVPTRLAYTKYHGMHVQTLYEQRWCDMCLWYKVRAGKHHMMGEGLCWQEHCTLEINSKMTLWATRVTHAIQVAIRSFNNTCGSHTSEDDDNNTPVPFQPPHEANGKNYGSVCTCSALGFGDFHCVTCLSNQVAHS